METPKFRALPLEGQVTPNRCKPEGSKEQTSPKEQQTALQKEHKNSSKLNPSTEGASVVTNTMVRDSEDSKSIRYLLELRSRLRWPGGSSLCTPGRYQMPHIYLKIR